MPELIGGPDISRRDRVLDILGPEQIMAELGRDPPNAERWRGFPIKLIAPIGRGCSAGSRSQQYRPVWQLHHGAHHCVARPTIVPETAGLKCRRRAIWISVVHSACSRICKCSRCNHDVITRRARPPCRRVTVTSLSGRPTVRRHYTTERDDFCKVHPALIHARANPSTKDWRCSTTSPAAGRPTGRPAPLRPAPGWNHCAR